MITQAEKGFQVFLMTPSLHDRKNAFKQFSNKFISVCVQEEIHVLIWQNDIFSSLDD